MNRYAPLKWIFSITIAWTGCAMAASIAAAEKQSVRLEVAAFPPSGPSAGLEPEVLDYRYAPPQWQACIGLPDDPYKTLVGNDGGLYYQFGGGNYHEFQVRVLADCTAEGKTGPISQQLLDPKTPIVVTQRTKGNVVLEQNAWAAAPQGKGVEQWSLYRTDYLWLTMKNRGKQETKGQITVQIDGKDLRLDESRRRLTDRNGRLFLVMSPACEAIPQTTKAPAISIDSPPNPQHNWARPTIAADRRFQDVIVGQNRPLVMKYRGQPGKAYRVALGLIEGWHSTPGHRPLEIRIEGKAVRTVDLVKEFGHNVPTVLSFDATARDGDGLVEISVGSPAEAEDHNTILSGLWIYEQGAAPSDKEILTGGGDAKAIAVLDAERAAVGQSVRLTFAQRTLAPGEQCQVFLALPQGAKAVVEADVAKAADEFKKAVDFWRQVDLPYGRFCVPDPAMQGLVDSCIRNIYQAREIKEGRPAFQVGPTCYRGTWAADGPFILESITYLGRASEVRAGLENQIDGDTGPGGVEFSKKSGLRLWMVWRHAQLTGDRAWLKKMWPRVEREVNQIIAYRKMTQSDPSQANFGLMPIGFGDGGLGGKHREYTNVYWTMAGLRAAIEMAGWTNSPQLAAWRAEYADYWKAFDKARQRDQLRDAAGNTYVPVTMKGAEPQLPQRGAWAFLQSVFPGRIFDCDDRLMLGTVNMLDANQREGLIYGTGWIADGIWNYAGSFYAHAHLWLGHGKKAAATLYAFGNHACPLLCWREEQKCRGEAEGYCGDMPHNWASAELLRLVRHLIILERGDQLHLLQGLPKSWTKSGNETRLVDVPTSFGDVSVRLKMTADGNRGTLHVTPPNREPPKRMIVHLEQFGRPVARVQLNGRDLAAESSELPTDKPFTLEIEFKP